MAQVLDDLRARLLVLTGASTTLHTLDLYALYLRSLGFTGTLADMKAQYALMIGQPLTKLDYYIAAGGGGFNGPNLILNGTFDTDLANWTSGDTGTGISAFSAGQLSTIGTDGTTNRGLRHQTFNTVANRIHRITFNFVSNAGSGSLFVGPTSNSGLYSTNTVTGASSRSILFTPLIAAPVLTLRNGPAGADVLWDDIDIRALT